MKNLIYLLIIIFTVIIPSGSLFANSTVDSLNRLSTLVSGADKISVLNQLAEEYSKKQPDKSIELSKKSLELANRHDDDQGKINAYKNLGIAWQYKNKLHTARNYYNKALEIANTKPDKAQLSNIINNIGAVCFELKDRAETIKHYEKALELRRQIGDPELILKSVKNISMFYKQSGEFDKALKYLDTALNIYMSEKDNLGTSSILAKIGKIHFQRGDYDKALHNYITELELRKESGIEENTEKFLTNIGMIYMTMGNFVKAEEYYEQALRLNQAKNDPVKIARSLTKLGILFYNNKNYNQALMYYTQALALASESGKSRGKAIVYNNMGLVYTDMGDFDKALHYCKMSLALKEKTGKKSDVFFPLTSIAQIYLKKNDYANALNYLRKSLRLAEELHNTKVTKDSYLLMFEAYNMARNYKEALNYFRKFSDLKDSLFNEASNKKIAEMQVKYEAAKKEEANKRLKEVNIVQRYFFIASIIFVLIIIVILYFRYRSKQKANKELHEKSRQIEQQNKDLEYMFAQLQHKEKVLTEANITKDKFFSIIAHDLRNPLSAITLSAEMLLAKYKQINPEQLARAVGNIYNAGSHLSDLLDNLLQWARAQSGSIQFNPEPIDPADIANSNIMLLGESARKKNIRLRIDIPQDIKVTADTNMTKTIMRNLVSNAIKFTPVDGNIKIKATLSGQFVQIEIIDSGVGISPEDITKLFRTDVKHTTVGTAKEKGTGLGLILCKEFVEISGGSISVKSGLGLGSTFMFTLPAAE